MVIFSGVSAGYNKRAVLHDINISFASGFHVVLGANGAGKTTFFRVAAGILEPLTGHVSVDGVDVARDVGGKNSIGYVSHRPGLQPRLSVLDNLRFWSSVLDQPKPQFTASLERVTAQLDLGKLLPQLFGRLSRGQQQRASLARALLGDPDVLYLDEPTTGLDPIVAKTLRNQLKDFVVRGRTIVYTTHNLYEAEELATNVVLLKDGRIVAQGSVDEIRSSLHLATRLSLVLDGDPKAVFERLHLSVTHERGAWLVEDADGLDTSKLIENLIGAGVHVREARDENNSLQAVYEDLQR
jgi:ABC-type multidrug transport system ATPase subunit